RRRMARRRQRRRRRQVARPGVPAVLGEADSSCRPCPPRPAARRQPPLSLPMRAASAPPPRVRGDEARACSRLPCLLAPPRAACRSRGAAGPGAGGPCLAAARTTDGGAMALAHKWDGRPELRWHSVMRITTSKGGGSPSVGGWMYATISAASHPASSASPPRTAVCGSLGLRNACRSLLPQAQTSRPLPHATPAPSSSTSRP
ncbi:unnamed protein product, partial [Urochloa humidicola]